MHYLISTTKLPKKSVHVSQFYINHLNHLNVWLASDQGPWCLSLELYLWAMWNSDLAINFPPFFVSSLREFKDYVHYKTIISQNVLFEAQIKNFLFCGKVMFRSQDIQVFVFLTISWFAKSMKSWWVLVHEIGCIFEYIFWTTTHHT